MTPVRTLTLDPQAHRLAVEDVFEGEGEHDVIVPLHLRGVEARIDAEIDRAIERSGRSLK